MQQSSFRWWYLVFALPLLFLRICLKASSSSSSYSSYNTPLYVPPPINTTELPDLSFLYDAGAARSNSHFREASATATDLARQASEQGLTKVATAAYAVDTGLTARDCDQTESAMEKLEASMKGVDAGESFGDTYASLRIEVKVACMASASAGGTEKVFTEKPIRKN